jgi:cytochrome P450
LVEQGTLVATFLYGYQRNPEYWPRAECFLPERWLPVRDINSAAAAAAAACQLLSEVLQQD